MSAGDGTDLLPGEPREFGGGRYTVRRRLGAGNFATVYLAYDERLDVLVAVKLLSDRWSWEPEVRGRFVQEARILRSLNTPHVVQIRDIAETDDGRPYLVMDYATHGTLEQRLVELAQRGRRPTVEEIRAVARAMGDALAFLHERRIAHRDIKPSNVLITRDRPGEPGAEGEGAVLRDGERMMLGDLGLAKNLSFDSGVTVGVGTAGYMAPEQTLAGGTIDTRTDIYAASAVLAQVASGELPDPVRRYSDGAIKSGRPLPPSIPAPLARALAHGLDTDPDRRPQTIREWQAEIDAALRTQPRAPAVSTAVEPGPAAVAHAAPVVMAQPPPPHSPRRPSRLALVAGASVLLALVVGGVLLAAGDDSDGAGATIRTEVDETDVDTTDVDTTDVDETEPVTTPATTAVPTTANVVTLPTTVAPTDAFVDIRGPVFGRVGVEISWTVVSEGAVSGFWSLTGPVQPNPAGWSPGDGFRGMWNVEGTFTLTLTAVDGDGNPVSDSVTFTIT